MRRQHPSGGVGDQLAGASPGRGRVPLSRARLAVASRSRVASLRMPRAASRCWQREPSVHRLGRRCGVVQRGAGRQETTAERHAESLIGWICVDPTLQPLNPSDRGDGNGVTLWPLKPKANRGRVHHQSPHPEPYLRWASSWIESLGCNNSYV